ncbi:methionyl-tRNA formyltransferase [Herbaspirillum robiniae]|uniref:Methionyl-tRNA formyltransferase n=1 Tax=Herbaspirillum robiniae TaxID=2014887 RepID=A0A246WM19_9BURK|nr:methionyl-tRNA formyltransferase [Herbaspirillum robiniae]OWY27302.1 methionyl-tRNA formyltransferase [Herbaspirillum robiniae]
MADNYIVASCKAWHKTGFNELSKQEKGRWHWVESPDELLQSVNQTSGLRYIFFLHWNWHVPVEIWSRFECVCFHMTDVPYGRGGSPLQNLIVAGHKNTKLSALQMVHEMDAGPVYVKRELPLDGRAEEIYIRAGQLSFDIIRWITRTEPEAVPQEGDAVIFKRRKPEQSMLPSMGYLEALYDHIRMLDAPTYPLAFIQHGDFQLELSNAQLFEDEIVAKVVIRKKSV